MHPLLQGRGVVPTFFVRGHHDDAVVPLALPAFLLLREANHADRFGGDDDARIRGQVVIDHRVERIPVLGPRAGDESPVVRVGCAQHQRAGELEGLLRGIVLELRPRTARSFDHHLQVAVLVVRGKIEQVRHDRPH